MNAPTAVAVGDILDLCLQHLAAGEIVEAETLARRILDALPGHRPALHRLGQARLLAKDPAGALACFEQSAPADDGAVNADALCDHAAANRAIGRWEEAETLARAALGRDPDFAPAHYALGLALAGRGERAAGAASCALALAMIPPTQAAMTGIEGPLLDARFRIAAYHERCRRTNAPARVVLGGHWSVNRGWLVLTRADQCLTRPLAFADASLDTVFVEDTLSWLPVEAVPGFLAEVLRVLKPGGRLRLVEPLLERLLEAGDDPIVTAAVAATLPAPAAKAPEEAGEMAALVALGLPAADGRLLLLHYARRVPERRFLWSARLLTALLARTGFSGTAVHHPGDGPHPELCLERSPKILPLLYNPPPDFVASLQLNPEMLAVEAVR